MLMSAAPPPQGAECQLMWTFVKNLIKTLGQHNIATLSLFNSTHCTDYTRVPRMISPCVGLSGGGVVTLTEARLRVPLPRTSLSKVT